MLFPLQSTSFRVSIASFTPTSMNTSAQVTTTTLPMLLIKRQTDEPHRKSLHTSISIHLLPQTRHRGMASNHSPPHSASQPPFIHTSPPPSPIPLYTPLPNLSTSSPINKTPHLHTHNNAENPPLHLLALLPLPCAPPRFPRHLPRGRAPSVRGLCV